MATALGAALLLVLAAMAWALWRLADTLDGLHATLRAQHPAEPESPAGVEDDESTLNTDWSGPWRT